MFPGLYRQERRRTAQVSGATLMSCMLVLGLARQVEATPGDLNGDSVADMQDVVLALKTAGGITEAGVMAITNGDVAGGPDNGPDGIVGFEDAVRIARAVNGLDDLEGGATDPPAAMPKIDTVSFASDFTKSYQLDAAYRVSGSVVTTQGLPISSVDLVGTAIRNTSGLILFRHAGNQLASDQEEMDIGQTDFSVLLGQGQNNVTIQTNITDNDPVSGAIVTYSVVQDAIPATLDVSGNTTGVSFVRPDVPPPGTVDGSVSGSNFTPTFLFFTSEVGASASSLVTDSAYSFAAAPGTGHLNVLGHLSGDTAVSVQAYLYESPVTVMPNATTSMGVTVPLLATLTGTVTTPTGTIAASATITDLQVEQNSYTSNNTMSAADQTFKLAVPPGSYNLSIALPRRQIGGTSLNLSYGSPVTVDAGENTQDVVLPPVPANVTFSGIVMGPDNRPRADVTMAAAGVSASEYTVSALTRTAANGEYAFSLPPGSYTVTLFP